MVVDYSKWDKLELSDDSDIEVHPNVDKKSFVRWRQRDIHEKRERNKMRTAQLDVNIETNTDLLRRIERLISAAESGTRVGNDIDASVALAAQGETKIKPAKATSPEQPKYDDLIASMLTDVAQENGSPEAVLVKLREHKKMIEDALREESKELESLHEERARYIGSEDLHDGFNSTIINKGTPSASASDADAHKTTSSSGALAGTGNGATPGGSTGNSTKTVEVINAPSTPPKPSKNADGLEELLPATKEFGEIKKGDLPATYRFLKSHAYMVTEGQKDALMMSAFDTELAGDTKATERIVHNALLIQYSALLGPGGADQFYSRIQDPKHPAREAFEKEVRQTYEHIVSRCKVLKSEHDAEQEESGEGTEQIQLHAVDPDTEIVVTVPEEGTPGRAVYDGFPAEIREAVATRSLDEINKVLANMSVDEAETLVAQFSESGVLLVEDKIYDATEFQRKQAAAVEAEHSLQPGQLPGHAPPPRPRNVPDVPSEEPAAGPVSTIDELD